MHSLDMANRWAKYLLKRDGKLGQGPGMVVSEDGGGKVCWWIVYDCPDEVKEFTRKELAHIRKLIKASGVAKVYVVVSFDGRFVAASAENALRAKVLDPDRGGVPW